MCKYLTLARIILWKRNIHLRLNILVLAIESMPI